MKDLIQLVLNWVRAGAKLVYQRMPNAVESHRVPDTFSVREALQGALVDFIKESGFDSLDVADLVRDLVCQVLSYREEDVPLFPELFIIESKRELSIFAPSAATHLVGTCGFGSSCASTILKSVANLARDGWAAYVVPIEDNEVEYGVFRAHRHSLAVAADEALADLDAKTPTIVIRNRGTLSVELASSGCRLFTVLLTSERPTHSKLSDCVATFSTVATAMGDDNQEFYNYLQRFLVSELQNSHGTLLLAIDGEQLNPDNLGDGVWIEPAIDLSGLYRNAKGPSGNNNHFLRVRVLRLGRMV